MGSRESGEPSQGEETADNHAALKNNFMTHIATMVVSDQALRRATAASAMEELREQLEAKQQELDELQVTIPPTRFN
jgi:hypothetical protein